MPFDPEDVEEVERMRDVVAERFAAVTDPGWACGAHNLMDLKIHYLGGDPTSWTATDLEEVLLEILPAKVMLTPEDVGQVIPGAAFLRFLEGILAHGRANGERLAAFVERLSDRFAEAAGDESRWSVGTRVTMALLGDGVDPADEEAVEGVDGRVQRPSPGRAGGPEGAKVGAGPDAALLSEDRRRCFSG